MFALKKTRRTAARPNHLAATATARNYSSFVKASNLEPFYFGLRMLAIWESQTVHRPSLVLSCSSWLDNPPDSSHHSSPESVEMFITWKLDYWMPKIRIGWQHLKITSNFWAKYSFTKLQRTQKGIRLSKWKHVEQVVFAKNTSSSSLFRPNILNLRERYYWSSGQNMFERVARVIEQHQKDLRGCLVG